MVFFNSLQSVLSIIIMIFIGYILTVKGWLNENISKTFSKIVCNLALPCLMISDLMNNFTKDKLLNLGGGLIIPFVSMAIGYLIAFIVSKVLKIDKSSEGTFRSMFFVSSSIFIGLPVNLALFGESSVPYVLLYYIANTIFFWTIGVYDISKDSQDSSCSSIFSITTLKRIVSPPLLGFMSAIVLILLDIHLPKFAMDTFKYLGGLTTPLSMLFIGITMTSIKPKEIEFNKDMAALFIGRFVISPLLVFILAYNAPIPLLMKKVFIIQAAMPVMTNTAIVARSYGANYKYASVMTVVTTLLSIVFVPFYMILM